MGLIPAGNELGTGDLALAVKYQCFLLPKFPVIFNRLYFQ